MIFKGYALASCMIASSTARLFSQEMTLDAPIPPALELPHPKLPAPNLSTDVPWPWWYWLAGALIVLVVLWIISELSKSLQTSRHHRMAPLIQARKRLDTLGQELDRIPMEQLSHFVSQVIRLYQHEKYLQPFQCQTMEEIYEHGMLSQSEAIKSIFYPFAQKLETISFSPHRENIERKQQLLNEAWEVLSRDDSLPDQSLSSNPSSPTSAESVSVS